MENKPENDPDNQGKGFQPRVLLIWLAILAAIVGLVVVQSDPQRSHTGISGGITNVDQLFMAKEDKIVRAIIESDPKGGEEWYQIKGEFTDYPVDPESGEIPTGRLSWLRKGYRVRLQELKGAAWSRLRESPSSTVWTDLLFSLLPFLLIIGLLYFLFVRQLRMAGKGALNFGKSKAKMLTRENEKILFNDVAGCDEAKEEVSEVVDFLKDPKRFSENRRRQDPQGRSNGRPRAPARLYWPRP